LGRRDVAGSEENLLARMCIPGYGDLVAQSRLWRDPSQAFWYWLSSRTLTNRDLQPINSSTT
jgi:hypothetical protein